jgi:hypothetical protein
MSRPFNIGVAVPYSVNNNSPSSVFGLGPGHQAKPILHKDKGKETTAKNSD